MTRSAPFVVLGIGVAIVSTASILIRYAQADGASSALIAAGRLSLAALLMAPLALSRAGPELLRLRRKDLLLCATSGLLLGAHFWTWTASLEYTSVANSTVLVTTNPVWVALLSAWLLKEKPRRVQLIGVSLTLAGTLLIFLAENAHGTPTSAPLLGNSLALLGALAASGYLLIAALALGPQLLGHTSFNWALRRLSATFVALSILGEPIGSALLAWWLLDEGFVGLQLAGFAALLGGILVAARAENTDASEEHANTPIAQDQERKSSPQRHEAHKEN